MKNAGKARSYGLYRHLRTSKEIIENLLNYYIQEDNFDKFANNLRKCDVQYIHPVKEHSWGQRVVRFYDPDRHIIEVGENMKVVCKRFIDSGMTPEQTAERMDVPVEYVNECMQ